MTVRADQRIRSLLAGVTIVLTSAACRQPAPPSEERGLVPYPAEAFITDAFERRPLVALSELHGSRESAAFLASVIRHPGFAGTVDDIVVEFGNARYQDAVDRYIAGEPVARDELRGAWENTTQVSGIWLLPMYEAILADIRAFNSTLPSNKRFRVLLGDPPIDWRTITSPADDDMNDWRDAHFAWVVEHQVLARRRKALLFVGGGHIGRKVIFPNSLIHLLDAKLPGGTAVIQIVDAGTLDPSVRTRLQGWRVPAAAPVRGTWLGRSDVQMVGARFSRGLVEDDHDAVLYLSQSPLVLQPPAPVDGSTLLGAEYRRRRQLAQDTLPFRGAQIRFAANAPSLNPESAAALAAVAAGLASDPTLRVVIKAFADTGEPEPAGLTTERARTVVAWLVSRGVARERLQPLGCGATRLLWADDEETHRAANRRAEIVRNTPSAGCHPPASFEGI